MRINIESVFEHFDRELRNALAHAVEEVAPQCDAPAAARIYQAFRRNAIVALSPWEQIPAEAASDTMSGFRKPGDGGITLSDDATRKTG